MAVADTEGEEDMVVATDMEAGGTVAATMGVGTAVGTAGISTAPALRQSSSFARATTTATITTTATGRTLDRSWSFVHGATARRLARS